MKPAAAEHFNLLWPKIRPGGCVLIDNATTHKKELGPFIESLRSRSDARTTEVAIGNGLAWIIKIASPG